MPKANLPSVVVLFFGVSKSRSNMEIFFIMSPKGHPFAHFVKQLSNSRALFGYAVGENSNSVSYKGAGNLNFGKNRGMYPLCRPVP